MSNAAHFDKPTAKIDSGNRDSHDSRDYSRLSDHQRETLASMERVERLMDRSVPLPGGIRLGLDSIVGLIPGIGDFATSIVSGSLFLKAMRLGLPKTILARMAFNILVDALVGSIPFFGDIFDVFFKANTRNMDLIRAYYMDPVKAERKATRSFYGLLGITLFLLFLFLYAAVKIVAAFFAWLF